MDNMLEGIDGTKAIIDDILIGGETGEEQDRILDTVVQRGTEYNMGINCDKCYIKQKRTSM